MHRRRCYPFHRCSAHSDSSGTPPAATASRPGAASTSAGASRPTPASPPKPFAPATSSPSCGTPSGNSSASSSGPAKCKKKPVAAHKSVSHPERAIPKRVCTNRACLNTGCHSERPSGVEEPAVVLPSYCHNTRVPHPSSAWVGTKALHLLSPNNPDQKTPQALTLRPFSGQQPGG